MLCLSLMSRDVLWFFFTARACGFLSNFFLLIYKRSISFSLSCPSLREHDACASIRSMYKERERGGGCDVATYNVYAYNSRFSRVTLWIFNPGGVCCISCAIMSGWIDFLPVAGPWFWRIDLKFVCKLPMIQSGKYLNPLQSSDVYELAN